MFFFGVLYCLLTMPPKGRSPNKKSKVAPSSDVERDRYAKGGAASPAKGQQSKRSKKPTGKSETKKVQ